MKHMIFGESHGTAIGVTLDGVPSGITLDWDFINSEMARRAPGNSPLATARKEADQVEILSGVFEGKTTGTPLCAVIQNGDTRSKDYSKLKDTPRPSHGDYAGFVRYQGCNDYRGGGHFSGRLTAPLVFAGALAKLILIEKGIEITSEITNIGGVKSPSAEQMEEVILRAKEGGNSVGGQVKVTVSGVPVGIGSPDFGCNVEGVFAQHMFAIPAVKAVEFGLGTGFADMLGSDANDAFYMDGNQVKTKTNHAGGINGGITNGMPITCQVTFRPTPSIGQSQDTVSLTSGENTTLEVTGRHDPCVVQRAVPVVEAAAALAVCEVLKL